MNHKMDFRPIYKEFESSTPFQYIGKIISNKGMLYEAVLPRAVMGCSVEFVTQQGNRCMGEVVGINANKCQVMPYEEIIGINSETKVYLRELTTSIKVSKNMLGRVIDFQGNPIDGRGPIDGPFEARSIFGEAINPLDRPTIRQPLNTGVNAINSFMSVGKGQRIAIMAGSGVGKSTLMGMIAKNSSAEVNVIALVGERGREVLEFIESELGAEGMENSVIMVATSDSSSLIRSKAAYASTTVAEFFRDQGKDVMFMMDSVTRFAMANREIGMSAGEPPGQKGYGPSVFAKLPKLLERAGTKAASGSITGIYTVLVEGDDMDEPIADAVRAIVDGHIVLTRELASKNHYPAIDVLASISRVMPKVISREHMIVAGHLRDLLSEYKAMEDLINVGAYARGTSPKVDKALVIYDDLMDLLRQRVDETLTMEQVYDRMIEIARKGEQEVDPNFMNVQMEQPVDLDNF